MDSLRRNREERRRQALKNLTCSLKEKNIQNHLKWSSSISEIPRCRKECQDLGDPLLFVKKRHMPASLALREEHFTDTHLATFSYRPLLYTSRKEVRTKQFKVGQEVSLSQLHDLANSSYSRHRGSRNCRTVEGSSSHCSHTHCAVIPRGSSTPRAFIPRGWSTPRAVIPRGFSTPSVSTRFLDSSNIKIFIRGSGKLTIEQIPQRCNMEDLFKTPDISLHSLRSEPETQLSGQGLLNDRIKHDHIDTLFETDPALTKKESTTKQNRLNIEFYDRQVKVDRTSEWISDSPFDVIPPAEA